jgi:5-guanidino-2-oxopentanoate decarboxylase
MSKTSCGEALVQLLEDQGVDTVFGMPGAHTLEIYRGLFDSRIRHVLVRHEQGAGFMADGYSRATGRPGVCILVSGPGITNAMTPIGQAYQDSIPLLIISSAAPSHTIGKAWSSLHEISNPEAVTAPLTGFSTTIRDPEELPAALARAFDLFRSSRPRPVHLVIPADILSKLMIDCGHALPPVRPRPLPTPETIDQAKDILSDCNSPLIIAGGGAIDAAGALKDLAEMLDAPVVTTNAGKGVLPESHPLSLGGTIMQAATQDLISRADAILAIGTEISVGDTYVAKLPINGKLIRFDIDPAQFLGLYPATAGIHGEAKTSVKMLVESLANSGFRHRDGVSGNIVAKIRQAVHKQMNEYERQHYAIWQDIAEATPKDTVYFGDTNQLTYTGVFTHPCELPGQWHWSPSWCTLGGGLPMAIGAKIAEPERPVLVTIGDGGIMFTIQELMTGAECGLPLPVLVWNNGGIKQIADLMARREMPEIAVTPTNPDFVKLAQSMYCEGIRPQNRAEFRASIKTAFSVPRPTLIELSENSDWLKFPEAK